MENLKIRVVNEAESREAQGLFFDLGCDFYFGGKIYCNTNLGLITANKEGLMANIELDGLEYKEITLPELHDMVVLKRNDVGDANYKDAYRDLFYVASDLNIYIWQHDSWIYHCIQGDKKKLESMWKFRNTGGDVGLLINKLNDKETLNDKVASAEEYRQAEVLPFIDDEPRLEFAKGIELDLIAKRLDLRERYEGETDEDYRYALQHYVVFSARPSIDDEPKNKGMKFDSNKPRFSLLPKGCVNSVIDVLEFGAKKYEKDNWQQVDNAKERYYNAAMRHIDLWWNGEKIDSETGIHHLAHAATNLFFLKWFDENA